MKGSLRPSLSSHFLLLCACRPSLHLPFFFSSLRALLFVPPQNVVKSVDSQQALYRFNSGAYITIFLTNNITCCLMLGGALLIYNTIDVQHKINKSVTPPALPWLLAAVSCLNFLFINVCTALAVTKLKQVYYLYILFYLISSFSVLMIIADCSVWNVRSLVLKSVRMPSAPFAISTAQIALSPFPRTRRFPACALFPLRRRYQDRSVSVRSKVLAAEKSLYPLYGFVIFLNLLLVAVIAALSYQANLIRTKNVGDRHSRASSTGAAARTGSSSRLLTCNPLVCWFVGFLCFAAALLPPS